MKTPKLDKDTQQDMTDATAEATAEIAEFEEKTAEFANIEAETTNISEAADLPEDEPIFTVKRRKKKRFMGVLKW